IAVSSRSWIFALIRESSPCSPSLRTLPSDTALRRPCCSSVSGGAGLATASPDVRSVPPNHRLKSPIVAPPLAASWVELHARCLLLHRTEVARGGLGSAEPRVGKPGRPGARRPAVPARGFHGAPGPLWARPACRPGRTGPLDPPP